MNDRRILENIKKAKANMRLEGYKITPEEEKLAYDYLSGKISKKDVIKITLKAIE